MEKHLFILSHLQKKYYHNDILYVRGWIEPFGKKIYTKPIAIMKRWLTRAAKTTNLHVDLLIPEQKKES